MNKKIGYVFTLLVLGLFLISACDQTVGRNVKSSGSQVVDLNDGSFDDLRGEEVDIEKEEELVISKPDYPNPENPEIQWVTGLECGGIINEELIEENDGDRDFVLTEDLECEGSGIMIEADDVNLVCNGHSITGPGLQVDSAYGIYVGKPHGRGRISGVSVMGCEVSNYETGIVFDIAIGGNELIDNNVHDNHHGILFSLSDSNTLTENTVNGNVNGIYLGYSSSSNTLTENTVNGNRNGIYLASSDSNTLTGNTVNGNEGSGIFFNVESLDNIITEQELVCITP